MCCCLLAKLNATKCDATFTPNILLVFLSPHRVRRHFAAWKTDTTFGPGKVVHLCKYVDPRKATKFYDYKYKWLFTPIAWTVKMTVRPSVCLSPVCPLPGRWPVRLFIHYRPLVALLFIQFVSFVEDFFVWAFFVVVGKKQQWPTPLTSKMLQMKWIFQKNNLQRTLETQL